jgi:hypothetical protein
MTLVLEPANLTQSSFLFLSNFCIFMLHFYSWVLKGTLCAKYFIHCNVHAQGPGRPPRSPGPKNGTGTEEKDVITCLKVLLHHSLGETGETLSKRLLRYPVLRM